MVAEAATRVSATSQAQAEQQRIQEQQQDPLIQMKEREVAVKEAEVQRKAQEGQAKIQLDTQKAMAQAELEKARIESQNEIAGANIGQRIASDLLDAQQLKDKQAREDYQKGVDIGIEIAKDSNKNEE